MNRLTDERLRYYQQHRTDIDPDEIHEMAAELLELRKEVEWLGRELKHLRSERAIAVYQEGVKELPDYSPADAETQGVLGELVELRKEVDRYKRRFHDAQDKLREWQEHTGCSCPSAAGELREENERLRELLAEDGYGTGALDDARPTD